VTFRPGQRVRVAARTHEGHCRTPAYLRGKAGTVARLHGSFTNPETRAYGSDGLPEKALYQVVFPQGEVWPGYANERDRIAVDVFEHWLEKA